MADVSCAGGDGLNGFKGYNLIFAKKGKGDEALVEINKRMFPFCQIEGSSWKLEPLMSVTDVFKVLEKKYDNGLWSFQNQPL